LIGAPLMDDVPDFNKVDYPLHQAALAEWEGFFFVNLNPEAEPFESAFSPLIGKFNRWNIAALHALRSQVYDVQANWKLIVQNYSECYHCPLIHPDLAQRSPYRSGNNDLYDGPFLGGFMEIEEQFGSLTLSGQACALPLGQVAGADLERVYYYSIFPNMLLSLHPDYVMCHTIWPLATNRTRIVCDWLFDPAQQGQDSFDPDDAAGFWDQTNRQDWHVCELAQRGVSSRLYAPSPYSPAESLLAAFDREYLRALA
jgi:Rieske 2Fe-2S family protein